jgi:hypothetical protein
VQTHLEGVEKKPLKVSETSRGHAGIALCLFLIDMPTFTGAAMQGNHTSEKETEDSDIVTRGSYYEES